MKYKNQVILVVAIILFTIFIGTSTAMATTAVVDTDTLKLRKEASTDSTVIELLNIGEKLEVIEQTGNWVKVKVKGMTGFVHKDYVKIEQEVNKAEDKDEEPKAEETKTEEVQNTESENTTVVEDIIVEENNTVKEQFTIREEKLTSNKNVYILPLINSTKIIELNKDTKIIVMDEVKGWLYIQSEEVNGWIRNSSSEENVVVNNENQTINNQEQQESNNEEEPTEEQGVIVIEEKVMYVNYSSIYVRKGPGTENEVVETLILNSQVVVTGESGDWYKVKVAGVEGYIAKRLLSNTKTEESTTRSAEERIEAQEVENEEQAEQVVTTNISKGKEIVNYAKQYLGCKYVYGGSGPSTFDCSGFTMYVYKHFGVSLSHSARAQSKNGTYVAKEDLKPGDLVFFKDYETMDGIGHCGIYIGDGNFIHASSGTGYCVKISTLLSGSYNTRYETARRLF